MTKLPLVIQGMDNKDTNNHAPSTHPKITQVKGWKYKLSLFLSTILSEKTSPNCCFDGKLKQGFPFKTNLLKNYAFTSDNDTISLAINNIKSSSKYFC